MNSRLKLLGGVFGAQLAEKWVDLTIAYCLSNWLPNGAVKFKSSLNCWIWSINVTNAVSKDSYLGCLTTSWRLCGKFQMPARLIVTSVYFQYIHRFVKIMRNCVSYSVHTLTKDRSAVFWGPSFISPSLLGGCINFCMLTLLQIEFCPRLDLFTV